MRYYPVNLDIADRNCLVVGGGRVGARKAAGLVKAGAQVTVISPIFNPCLLEIKSIKLIRRTYCRSDLKDMFLVFSAIDDPAISQKIYHDAEQLNILCNVADQPRICNFILPAVASRGDLSIAVSTSGQSPALAKKLRQDFENQFGPEYADFLILMGALRKKLLAKAHQPEEHQQIFNQLIESDLIEKIRDQDIDAINALLEDIVGEGFMHYEL